jgi:hypothetical protein
MAGDVLSRSSGGAWIVHGSASGILRRANTGTRGEGLGNRWVKSELETLVTALYVQVDDAFVADRLSRRTDDSGYWAIASGAHQTPC